VPGATAAAEILVDPNGERTIIAHAGRRRPRIKALPLSGNWTISIRWFRNIRSRLNVGLRMS